MGKVIIIAEAGVNHNGDLSLAKEMISRAKEAGADYIKFQTAVPENVISKFAPKANYQIETTGCNETQLEMAKSIHLPLEDYYVLKRICDEIGIRFLSTPFDLDSIDLLSNLDMDFWKIPSGEITNYPYLKKIGEIGGKVILSTGMSTVEEIKDAVNLLVKSGIVYSNISLLHCNTEYPTPMKDVNLNVMRSLKEIFKLNIGFSDHTKGIEIPIAAVALGAQIIEKHFTLDKSMKGPDHKASLDPFELKVMVECIRNIEEALGSDKKHVTNSEFKNITIARKSIVAKKNIVIGEVFTNENITTKRPGSGISPMRWTEIIGKVSNKNYLPDDLIEEI